MIALIVLVSGSGSAGSQHFPLTLIVLRRGFFPLPHSLDYRASSFGLCLRRGFRRSVLKDLLLLAGVCRVPPPSHISAAEGTPHSREGDFRR